VPVVRYFMYVGVVLLAMLFVADQYFSGVSQSFVRDGQVDKSVIRIQSAHRWPDKIDYDVSLPTIVPTTQPAQAAAAEPPKPTQPREAFASIAPAPEVAKPRAPPKIKRKVARRAMPTRMAAFPPYAEPLPAGW
jgi:hypothetical protein